MTTHGKARTPTLSSDRVHTANALELNFSIIGYMGNVMTERPLPLSLPDKFLFTFDMRADGPVNTIEFCLIDLLGNVYRTYPMDYPFPTTWITMWIKRHHLLDGC